MKKYIAILFVFAFFLFAADAQAQTACSLTVNSVQELTVGQGSSEEVTYLIADISASNITVDGEIQNATGNDQFYINVPNGTCGVATGCRTYIHASLLTNGSYSDQIERDDWDGLLFSDLERSYEIQLVKDTGPFSPHIPICSSTVSYTPPAETPQCSSPSDIELSAPSTIDRQEQATFSLSGAPDVFNGENVYLYIYNSGAGGLDPGVVTVEPVAITSGSGQASFSMESISTIISNGTYRAVVKDGPDSSANACSTTQSFTVTGDASCLNTGEVCDPNDSTPLCGSAVCTCDPDFPDECRVAAPQISTFEFVCTKKDPPACNRCEYLEGEVVECVQSTSAYEASCAAACERLPGDTSVRVGCNSQAGTVDTAIGCVHYNSISEITRFFLQWSLSIGGGVALLLIGLSAIMFATSSGSPDRVNNAKSLFMAALGGLLFLLLSVFLLRTIGVNILGLFA